LCHFTVENIFNQNGTKVTFNLQAGGGTKGFESKNGSKLFGAVDFASRFVIIIKNIDLKFKIY
jgi:hypothetical protein